MKLNKILIVEDEGIQAMNTKLMLLRLGYEVLPIALSGKSAVDLALEHSPDLIMMDIRLRGSMDGIEAAGIIKKKMTAPVIFVSAYADDMTMKRLESADPAGFMEKPVDSAALSSMIAETLSKQ